jgi:hypothetical protein
MKGYIYHKLYYLQSGTVGGVDNPRLSLLTAVGFNSGYRHFTKNTWSGFKII